MKLDLSKAKRIKMDGVEKIEVKVDSVFWYKFALKLDRFALIKTDGGINSAPIALTQASTIYFLNNPVSGKDYELSGSITGNYDITFTGTNTNKIILSGSNSYAKTTIQAGQLQVGHGATTGTLGTGSIANSGTLIFNRTDNVMIPNAITGTGKIIKESGNKYGFGTLTQPVITRNNATYINGNRFNVSRPLIVSALSIFAGGLTSGTLLKTATVGIYNPNGTLLVSKSVPAGTPVNADGFAYVSIPPVTLVVGIGYATAAQVGIGFNALIDANVPPNVAFNPVSGNGITVDATLHANTGTFSRPTTVTTITPYRWLPVNLIVHDYLSELILTGANTMSGDIDIHAGTLSINSQSNVGTAKINMAPGSILKLNGATITNTIVNNGGTVIP